jgi:hypothetical protein
VPHVRDVDGCATRALPRFAGDGAGSDEEAPATFLPLVPPIADRLLAAAKAEGVSLAGTEVAISGAMALPHDSSCRSSRDRRLPRRGIRPVGVLARAHGESRGTQPQARHGRAALPGTECRVVDPDQPSVDVPAGERGELIVRGPQVFQGYYGKPEATEEVFVDGWFRTGDIVQIDEDGFVRIVDRIKELIITGGFNVAPTEVENALRQHPRRGCRRRGPAERAPGEEVVAAVVLDGSGDVDVDSIREFARGILTPYKVPRRIYVVDELPDPHRQGAAPSGARVARDAHTPRRLTCVSRRRGRAPRVPPAPARRSRNCAASMIRMPRLSAFVSLEPAPGPAATKSVFFETLEAALPPAARMASSRLRV